MVNVSKHLNDEVSLGEKAFCNKGVNIDGDLFRIFRYFCRLEECCSFRRMKVIAFIISFIILGLSCLPCSDSKPLVKDATAVSVLTQLHSDPSDTHPDLCNPFCSCACCGVTPTAAKITPVTLDLPRAHSVYVDRYASGPALSIALPIWQPPQLLA